MGLDQYLEGRKHYSTWDPHKQRSEDGFPVEHVVLQLGYWRKHPDLHGYIVEMFAEGKDECQDIELSSEQIDELMDAIKEDRLPKTSGFFFGESDGTEKEEDLRIFAVALAWLALDQDVTDPKPFGKYIVYKASW